MSTDTLLSPEQVAERLQVSEYTALKWLREGRIKGRKLGKFWRVKAEDLEAFIDRPPTLRLVETPQAQTPPANGTPHPLNAGKPVDPGQNSAQGRTMPPADTPQTRKAALLPRLQAMQAEGLTRQAIANRLNAEGVPTLSGHGRWQKGTISNLLAEAEGTR
jgi:excisionase family DNA binding protein